MSQGNLESHIQTAKYEVADHNVLDTLIKDGNKELAAKAKDLHESSDKLSVLLQNQPELKKILNEDYDAIGYVESMGQKVNSLAQALHQVTESQLSQPSEALTTQIHSRLGYLVSTMARAHELLVEKLGDNYSDYTFPELAEEAKEEDATAVVGSIDDIFNAEKAQPQPVPPTVSEADISFSEEEVDPVPPNESGVDLDAPIDMDFANDTELTDAKVENQKEVKPEVPEVKEVVNNHTKFEPQEKAETKYRWGTKSWKIAGQFILPKLIPSKVSRIHESFGDLYSSLAKKNPEITNRILYYLNAYQANKSVSPLESYSSIPELDNLKPGAIIDVPPTSELRNAIFLPLFKQYLREQIDNKGNRLYDDKVVDMYKSMPIGKLVSGQIYAGELVQKEDGTLSIPDSVDDLNLDMLARN